MALTISFKGKKVLITGAARGLGHDLVKVLYAQEAVVFALARNPDNLAKLKEEFPKITTICVDLGDWNATRAAVEKVGPVDCLVNNAAVAEVKPFLNITQEHFDSAMTTNVKAVVNVSQVVANGMIAAGTGGSIINVSSIASKVYSKNITMYCTSKAAMDMLTKSMAVELGPHKIRVNSVNPCIFETDMSKNFLKLFPDGGPEYQSRAPLKRIANSEEIVNTILFLMSDAAPMINAETLLVDGGFTAT
jgi:L-xylulose reductase